MIDIDFLRLIDLSGIAAFAVSGAVAAMRKRLDLFGIFIIAFVTAMGGGTLRDLLIGEAPPVWMFDMWYGLTVGVSAFCVLFFTRYIENFKRTLLFFDSIGLGFFTILGVQKGLALDLHPVICVTLGTVTACFGGVIRDISLRTIPVIFHKEVYASACIAGGVLFFVFLYLGLNDTWVRVLSIATVFIMRMLAVVFNLRLPNPYRFRGRIS